MRTLACKLGAIADAVVHGDVAYVDRVTAGDFVMVHRDAWTQGGQPLLVDGKEALPPSPPTSCSLSRGRSARRSRAATLRGSSERPRIIS
jgi:hypothetical protein